MFLLTEDSPSHIQLETTQVWNRPWVNMMDQVTEFTSTYPPTRLSTGDPLFQWWLNSSLSSLDENCFFSSKWSGPK